jgi:hypothetical protein
MVDSQLPGVFGDVQRLLENYGYLGVERCKWYVIRALAVVVAIVIGHRVWRRRAARTA